MPLFVGTTLCVYRLSYVQPCLSPLKIRRLLRWLQRAWPVHRLAYAPPYVRGTLCVNRKVPCTTPPYPPHTSPPYLPLVPPSSSPPVPRPVPPVSPLPPPRTPVHTQGRAHKSPPVATAANLLFKGPQARR